MIQLQPNETIIKQDRIIQIHSAISSTFGTLYLTNQRVVVEKNKWAMVLGLVGWLLAKFFPGSIQAYPRTEIVSREQTKHGFNTNVLLLKFKDGKTWKLGLTAAYTEWDEAFKSA